MCTMLFEAVGSVSFFGFVCVRDAYAVVSTVFIDLLYWHFEAMTNFPTG